MWLGRRQVGDTVVLYVETKASANGLAIPDSPPQCKIFSGQTLIEQHLMPIEDRYTLNGWFRYTLFLGRLYTTGQYQVVYYYLLSGSPRMSQDNFEVIPGGDARGSVISTYFYERPGATHVVQGTETGLIQEGRNPTA